MGSIGDLNQPERHVTVLVTGFGPFQERYPVNPSYEIAKLLPNLLPGTTKNGRRVQIITYDNPIRVCYDEVRELIPPLLESFYETVDLVLHIGMSSGRDFYTAEEYAHRDGYSKNKDLDGETLSAYHGLEFFDDCPPIMTTSLDCEDVLRKWHLNLASTPETSPGLNAECRLSEDAGHYLCDYIYYNSLAWYGRKNKSLTGGDVTDRPVVFLHVPAESNSYILQRGRAVAIALIEAMVEHWCSSRKHEARWSPDPSRGAEQVVLQ